MHILPILTLILGLLINGFIKSNDLIFLMENIKNAVIQELKTDTFVRENDLIQTKEGDYYQDKEGNLVIIIPEGYSEGGLDFDD